MSASRVAVVGAGPNGISVATHLLPPGSSHADDEVVVFGEPMSFWDQHMPAGMLLRSRWDASHIDDPAHVLTLNAFESSRNAAISRPIPLADFIRYGRWVHQHVAPHADQRRVVEIDRAGELFRLTLSDGEVHESRAVVVAAGIEPFARRPDAFCALPPALVSHCVDHAHLDRFNGTRVAVIGGGQSAVESAVLLSEQGAEVEVIARTRAVRWLVHTARLHSIRPLGRLLYSPTDVGPPVVSRIVSAPRLFTRLPRATQDSLARRSIRPAVSAWVLPRVGRVRITEGRGVTTVAADDGEVRLALSDGTERTVDHVLLGTGYRVDVSAYDFLAPILPDMETVDGYPALDRSSLECSIPGLYFVGATAARTLGPTMRFVAGTRFSSALVARSLGARPTRRRAVGQPL